MSYVEMNLLEVSKLPGVSDITPVKAKAKFAQALKAEAEGDHTKAESLLEEACAA